MDGMMGGGGMMEGYGRGRSPKKRKGKSLRVRKARGLRKRAGGMSMRGGGHSRH